MLAKFLFRKLQKCTFWVILKTPFWNLQIFIRKYIYRNCSHSQYKFDNAGLPHFWSKNKMLYELSLTKLNENVNSIKIDFDYGKLQKQLDNGYSKLKSKFVWFRLNSYINHI
jgi:hypothetical protein